MPQTITSTKSFYNKIAGFYPLIDLFLKPQKLALFNKINLLPSGRLLEVGVGNGSHLPLYQKHQVYATDISERMLVRARSTSGHSAQLYLMDGESLQFEECSFDYIVLSHLLSVVQNPEAVVNEAFRVMKPGGKLFILNHFTPDNPLRYIDRGFSSISRWFYFKSEFYPSSIKALNKFKLEEEIQFPPFHYFKILIFAKP